MKIYIFLLRSTVSESLGKEVFNQFLIRSNINLMFSHQTSSASQMRTSGVNAALLRYLPSCPHGQPFGSYLYYDHTGPPGKGMSLCQMTEAETDPEGADSWQGQLHAAIHRFLNGVWQPTSTNEREHRTLRQTLWTPHYRNYTLKLRNRM